MLTLIALPESEAATYSKMEAAMFHVSSPLGFVAVYLAFWIVAAVRELGHVIAAVLTRQRVFDLHLTLVKPRWSVRLRSVTLWWGLVPIGSYTEAYPVCAKNLRWRRLGFAAAGPLSMALLCVSAAALQESFAPDIESSWPYATVQWVMVFSGIFAVTSLFDRRTHPVEGRRRFGFVLHGSPADPRPYLHGFQFRYGLNLMKDGDQVRARRWLHRSMRTADFLRIPNLRFWYATMLAGAGTYQRDVARLLRGEMENADSYAANPEQWLVEADNCVSALLYSDRTEFFGEGRELMELAVSRSPKAITLKGTLGSIYFELGELEQAEAMLWDVYTTSSSALDRGITAAYLAALSFRSGDNEKTCELVNTAREQAGQHPLVRRVLRESGLDVAGAAG